MRIYKMRKLTARRSLPILLATLVLCGAGQVGAQAAKKTSGGGDLASRATNPAAALIQLQLQNSVIPSSDKSDGYANTAVIQPVYPFVLGKEHYFQSIITRTTIPIVTTPDVHSEGSPTTAFVTRGGHLVGETGGVSTGGRNTGIGDTVFMAVPAHKSLIGDEGEFFTWGPILATTLPTASKDETGSGRWSLGPGILGLRNFTKVFNDKDSLLVGGFGYQQWSMNSDWAVDSNDRADVSKAYFAPVVVYHFKELFGQKGWYTALPDDLWQYDFEESTLVSAPLGLRLGRVFPIGKQPVNMFLQSWANPASSGGASANYAIKLNFTLIFPE
jgi:hypothetical protein